MNPFEDKVGLGVSASAGPPTFDNSIVVPVNLDTFERLMLENESDEEFHSDGFCPTDVAALAFPSWEESPSSPLAAEYNAKASI